MKTQPRYQIVRDRREQLKLDFPADKIWCDGTIDGTLATGDYSIVSLEGVFTVERKRNCGEWATNIFEARFIKELERLNKMDYPFIVFEFTMADICSFPVNSGIPQNRWKSLRVTPQLMMKKTIEFMIAYPNIKFVFAGDHARHFMSSLFKRIMEQVQRAK